MTTATRLSCVPAKQPTARRILRLATTTSMARIMALLPVSVVLVLLFLHAVQAQQDVYDGEIISTNCPVDATTCLECVSNECGWVTTGLCLVDCQYIADIACYSRDTVTDATTAEQVCAVVQQQLDDRATCGVATQCSTCVTIQKSNQEPCSWFAATETCETGECNILGCGVTTCSGDDDNEEAGGGGATLPSCQDTTNCNDCLSLNCSWAESGSCLNSCQEIADTGCYSPESFNGQGPAEICAMVEQERVDGELCRGISDCTTCVSTTLASDESRVCQWYVDTESSLAWCGTGDSCDMNGVCGSTECITPPPAPIQGPTTVTSAKPSFASSSAPSDPTLVVVPPQPMTTTTTHPSTQSPSPAWTARPSFCDDTAADPSECFGTCQECLAAGGAWAASRCQTSCLADHACYSVENFQGQSLDSICTAAANDKADEMLCRAVTDCATCTNTPLSSDQNRTCGWYVDDEGTAAWCGTGECDMNGQCGSNNCSTQPAAPTSSSVLVPPPMTAVVVEPPTRIPPPTAAMPPTSNTSNNRTGETVDLELTSRTASHDSTLRIGVLSILLGFAWVVI